MLKVLAAYLKSGPESCACGTISQLHAIAAQLSRCVYASSEHRDDQQVQGDRPDAKIVVPTKDLEVEPPPAHT